MIGGKAVRSSICWNICKDEDGCRWCILHAGSWNSQRQGEREKAQRKETWWQSKSSIPMWIALKDVWIILLIFGLAKFYHKNKKQTATWVRHACIIAICTSTLISLPFPSSLIWIKKTYLIQLQRLAAAHYSIINFNFLLFFLLEKKPTNENIN